MISVLSDSRFCSRSTKGTHSSLLWTKMFKRSRVFLLIFLLPVPEEAPTFLRGHPLNSTAILISWKGIPPSRYEEKLLGYRIRYRNKGSELYYEANTTSNLTQDVIKKLRPNTAYEIMVNGFNEIGHGRSSTVLVLKTLSSGMWGIYYFQLNWQSTVESFVDIRVPMTRCKQML